MVTLYVEPTAKFFEGSTVISPALKYSVMKFNLFSFSYSSSTFTVTWIVSPLFRLVSLSKVTVIASSNATYSASKEKSLISSPS